MGVEGLPVVGAEESRRACQHILDYIEVFERPFSPDGRYRQMSAAYYLGRVHGQLENIWLVNSAKCTEAAAANQWLASAQDSLTKEGVLGRAKAHVIFSAFDVISRFKGVDGALDFLISPSPDEAQPWLEYLVAVPDESILLDKEAQQLQFKQLTRAIDDFINS